MRQPKTGVARFAGADLIFLCDIICTNIAKFIVMKLIQFPKDLPIEAVEGVTSILGTLIASLKMDAPFASATNLADYQETLQELNRDLMDCFHLYDEWQHDPDSAKFKIALDKMDDHLQQAKALLNNGFKVH